MKLLITGKLLRVGDTMPVWWRMSKNKRSEIPTDTIEEILPYNGPYADMICGIAVFESGARMSIETNITYQVERNI